MFPINDINSTSQVIQLQTNMSQYVRKLVQPQRIHNISSNCEFDRIHLVCMPIIMIHSYRFINERHAVHNYMKTVYLYFLLQVSTVIIYSKFDL